VPEAWARPLDAGEGGRFAAIAPDGSVCLWEAGDRRAQARRLPGAEGVVALSLSRDHALALARDGRVWSWGENGHGQLGHSTDKAGAVRDPEPVPGLSDIVRVSAVPGASFALAGVGTLWGWGRVAWGRFGPAVKEDAARRPLRLAHVAQAIDVAGGTDAMLYLKRDGTVWFWGRLPPAARMAAPGNAVRFVRSARARGRRLGMGRRGERLRRGAGPAARAGHRTGESHRGRARRDRRDREGRQPLALEPYAGRRLPGKRGTGRGRRRCRRGGGHGRGRGLREGRRQPLAMGKRGGRRHGLAAAGRRPPAPRRPLGKGDAARRGRAPRVRQSSLMSSCLMSAA
jgi:hypothetical protein